MFYFQTLSQQIDEDLQQHFDIKELNRLRTEIPKWEKALKNAKHQDTVLSRLAGEALRLNIIEGEKRLSELDQKLTFLYWTA